VPGVRRMLHGDVLDLGIGDMIGKQGPVDPKLFTYIRYNAELTSEWLGAHGLGHIQPRDVQRLDSTSHVDDLQEVGRKVALQVQPQHFDGFLRTAGAAGGGW
jgi:hypothetical protein